MSLLKKLKELGGDLNDLIPKSMIKTPESEIEKEDKSEKKKGNKKKK